MKDTAPTLTFEQFLGRYYAHLGAADRPSCFIAYCRAEADAVIQTGEKRYRNYTTFKNLMSRHLRRRAEKLENQP